MEIYNGTYCVYIHINKTNDKVYVGKTIYGDNPNKRWKNGSGYRTQSYFYRAINKYTWDGFEHKIVASLLTKEEAINFEKLLIKLYNARNPKHGYNCTNGGEGMEGYHHTEESKLKQINSMKKYYSNPEYIQNMRDVSHKRVILQFTLDGIFVNKYESAMEVERQLGVLNATVSKCAFNQLPSAGGYIFLFEEDIKYIDRRVEKYLYSKKPRHEHIVQLSLDGKFISEWTGSADAGNALNISYKNINAVCRGKRNTAGGYRWMYLSDYENLNKI